MKYCKANVISVSEKCNIAKNVDAMISFEKYGHYNCDILLGHNFEKKKKRT